MKVYLKRYFYYFSTTFSMLMIIIIVLLLGRFRVANELIIDGKSMGFLKSSQEIEKLECEITKEIKFYNDLKEECNKSKEDIIECAKLLNVTQFDENFKNQDLKSPFSIKKLKNYELKPVFVSQIQNGKKITPHDVLKEGIMSKIDDMTISWGLFLDDKPLFGCKNETELKHAISIHKEHLAGSDASENSVLEYCKNVKIKKKTLPSWLIKNESEAVNFLFDQCSYFGIKVIKDEEQIELLPFKTETFEDDSMAKNQKKIVKEGKDGKIKIVKHTVIENGEKIKESLIKKIILVKAEKQIEFIGTKNEPTILASNFARPSPGGYLTSRFGKRSGTFKGKFHSGVDIGSTQGSEIVAANSGIVEFAGKKGGYGNYILIDHGNGIKTGYGHNSKILVSKGSKVKKGQVIAKMGSTGVSTGPHLHFEVIKSGQYQDPLEYVNY